MSKIIHYLLGDLQLEQHLDISVVVLAPNSIKG